MRNLLKSALLLAAAVCESWAGEALVMDFIKDMYNRQRFEDYSFLEKHCSQSLLKKLEQAYDYDCYDNVCYASWLFRSGVQDCATYTCETQILNVEHTDEGWFTYEFLDMGKKGRHEILIKEIDGKLTIEDLK